MGATMGALAQGADSSAMLQLRQALPEFYGPNYVPTGKRHRYPLTEEVQRTIYEHQHPTTCADKKFIVHTPHGGAGIGSLIHCISASVAKALNSDRIFLLHPTLWDELAHGFYCGEYKQGSKNECFFAPVSNCTMADVTPENHEEFMGVYHWNQLPHRWMEPFGLATSRLPLEEQKEHWHHMHGNSQAYGPPGMLHWWRGESSAYIMRLNKRTSDYLGNMRLARALSASVPLPLPPNTVQIHVRHGDKAGEMRLASWEEHLAAAEAVARDRGFTERFIFLSTEDPSVIQEAKFEPGWTVYFLPWDRVNEDYRAQQEAGDELVLFSIENLWVSLECTHFVGTLGSNWNRLVDEMRNIWPGDANSFLTPYADLSCDLGERAYCARHPKEMLPNEWRRKRRRRRLAASVSGESRLGNSTHWT